MAAHGGAAGPLDPEALFIVVRALPAPTAVLAADPPRFPVLAASDALLSVSGRPRDAVVGHPLADAFPNASPEDPQAGGFEDLRASLEAAVRTGTPQRMPRQRYDLQRPDGQWEVRYWDAVSTPVRGWDGAVRYVLHQTEDVTERVRSEQAAARSERRAEGILARMADAHLVLDHEFRVVALNSATERALGLTRDEMLGRTHWELFPTSVDSEAGWAYRRVVAEGVEQHITTHYVGDGYDWHLEIDAYPTDEGEGSGHGVAIFWRDVSGRVAAEAERARLLAEVETERERLRTLILHMPAPLALMDGPEHRFALVNAAFRRISGGGRDVTGLTLRAGFPELAGQGFFEQMDRVYATGEPWVGPETPIRFDRDGSGVQDTWFTLRYEPVRDAEGRVQGVLNFAMDVTDQVLARREVERLLAESERARARLVAGDARYRALLDALDVGFCVIEVLFDERGEATDYRYLEANRRFWVQSGLPEDMVGRRIREVAPNLEPRWFAAFGGVARTGEPTRLEDHAEGLGRWFEVFAFRVDDPTLRRVAVLFTDVSKARGQTAERERLLRESEAARTEAEAANRAKAEFLAVMSHELRTPLNAIGGYAELIELGIHGPVTDAQRTALARIQASQRHLLGLIAGVLDYSRVEAGAVTYRLADVPVVEAVAEAETLVAPQLRAKGLGYAWSGAEPALCVRADREKLQQILLNLLGNAVKFTEARRGVPGRIEVACSVAAGAGAGPASGGQVRIHVRDTGAGIAAEELERVFDPFVQADQRLTRPHAGVGLGLAISRDLARGMGGDLTAESTPGVGSTFTLTLPAAR